VLSFKKENSDLKRILSLLQETLSENNIPLPDGFQNAEGIASPSDVNMSPSPAVKVDLTALAKVEARNVSPSEPPPYQTPASMSMDSDYRFDTTADSYGAEIGINPFVTIDLTSLAGMESHKGCSTTAATGGIPVFEPPDNLYCGSYAQENELVKNLFPTLNSQAAMDFVLEYVRL
jgi:hypothetical protein